MNRTERLFQKQANLYRLQEKVDTIVTGIGTSPGARFRLTEDVVKGLHKVAMARLLESPGEYRTEEVHIVNSSHVVPSWVEVPPHMTMFCKYLEQNWDKRDLIHLAAFTLWRLNWVHPFQNGNGRTARAAAYLVLCAKHGRLLPPKNSVVVQIVRDKTKLKGQAPYYQLHTQADQIYKQTQDINRALQGLEYMLQAMLIEQIKANL